MKKNKSFIIKIILSIIYIFFLIDIVYLRKKKRIGVISCENNNNIGNNLVKYAIFIKLKELNFEPIIIALNRYKNIYFIEKHVNLKEIKQNYTELNEKDYDFLMVNSDQTWVNVTPNYLLDYGFLYFAKNWSISKFVYGASYPLNFWLYSKQFNDIASDLLKNFTGISVREISTIYLANKYLGVHSDLVLDPTFLIDKKYYLDLIKYYRGNFNFIQDYICIYQLDKSKVFENFTKFSSLYLNLTLYKVNIFENNYIENFIKCINNSKAVITDSYHGTIFSIIFEKPFISFINNNRGNIRFTSLRELLQIKNRIINPKHNIYPNISLLKSKFIINETLLNSLKKKSINFLKKNLFKKTI